MNGSPILPHIICPSKHRLSEAAYQGLLRRFVPTAASRLDSVDELWPYPTDDGIRHHADTTRTPGEGISHAMNLYALLPWIDTRPTQVKRNHEALLKYADPPPVRLPWYIQPFVLDDDDPELAPDLLDRLSMPDMRRRHTLALTNYARYCLYQTAIQFKMETYSGRHTRNDYVSACLEAIGLSWLSPSTDYRINPEVDRYYVPPNHNKLREGFGLAKQTHPIHPWQMTQSQIEEAIKNGHPGIHNKQPVQDADPKD